MVAAAAVTVGVVGVGAPALASSKPVGVASTQSSAAVPLSVEIPTFIQVGDSTAVGFDGTPGSPCGHSVAATSPAQIINKDAKATLVADRSCVGADTWGVIDQINSIPVEIAPKYVFVAAGANNHGMFGDMVGCVGWSDCSIEQLREIKGRVALLPAELDAMLAAISGKFPNAEIIMPLYANPIPTVKQEVGSGCPWLDTTELREVREFQGMINNAITHAVARFGGTLVHPEGKYAGHDMCAAPEKTYFIPLSLTNPAGGHANALGCKEMAKSYLSTLGLGILGVPRKDLYTLAG